MVVGTACRAINEEGIVGAPNPRIVDMAPIGSAHGRTATFPIGLVADGKVLASVQGPLRLDALS
jgi:hypothetical protein